MAVCTKQSSSLNQVNVPQIKTDPSLKVSKKEHKPELLAPAGSLEAFFAAIESGADAVYIGLREFSARVRAKNFTLGQLGKMLPYAHQRNIKIYITINTLIKEDELPLLVETLAELVRLRIDGLIVQDMAVARLVRNHFPTLALHASTQMTTNNLPGVKFLEELGFQRVVLARELQLTDIASISASTNTELEVFVHGALCFCISGQCHFSSLLGGHSGNRGRCAQPCRRLYSHRGKDGYYFSPNDLSTIELIPQLAAAGVASLKIEGRMKSADYVAKVVSAYRLMIDGKQSAYKETLAAAKELLKDSFGRTHTKGFLASANPADIANPWLRGGTGRYIGEVKKVTKGRILFETRDNLHIGDRLRLQPKSDQAGQAWTLRELYQNHKQVHSCKAGTLVELGCPFAAKAGDALFKVAAKDAFGMSDEAANRKLLASGTQKTAVRLKLACQWTEAGWLLQITAQTDLAEFTCDFQLGQLEPAHNSDMHGVLAARFDETGDTPFYLEELQVSDFPPLFIPPVRLKEIRRELYRKLQQALTATVNKQVEEMKRAAIAAISLPIAMQKRSAGEEELLIRIARLEEARQALAYADKVVIPLQKIVAHASAHQLHRLGKDADKIIWQLPFMIFDQDIPFYHELVSSLYKAGFHSFELNNHGQLPFFKRFSDLHLCAGYRIFSLNSQALQCWQEHGFSQAILYLEDDRANIFRLLSTELGIRRTVTAYAPVEAMTTRIRIKDVKSGSFQSDRGELYNIKNQQGLTVLTSATPFSLIGHLDELRNHGCNSFLLDLGATASEQRAQIVSAFRADRVLAGTTLFNYERGLV